jgi:hypothetical protein
MTGRAWLRIACVMACVPLLQVAAYPRSVSAQSVPLSMRGCPKFCVRGIV